MKTLKWIFKHLLRIFTWGLCLLFSLTLSLINNLSLMDLIPFSLIIILTVSQIIYYYHKQNDKDMVKSIMPFLFFLFFLCNFHLQWGNGHTLGILGYNTQLGLFTLLNISRKVGAIFYITSYILINIAFIFKFYFAIPKKIIPVIITIICLINIVFSLTQIGGWFTISIALYYLGYFLIKVIQFIKEFQEVE